MKRERLEDLGRIFVMMEAILDDDDCPYELYNSKHTLERFLEVYKDEEKLCDLHDWFRWKGEKLRDIYYLARGDEE